MRGTQRHPPLADWVPALAAGAMSMPDRSSRVLVVEDDEEMRELLKKVLAKEGYGVGLAANGAEALARLAWQPYDLVITNMLMPEGGGLQLLADIRARSPELPVIMITAFGDWSSYARALDLGVSAYINKPLRMAELLGAVTRVLASPARPREIP